MKKIRNTTETSNKEFTYLKSVIQDVLGVDVSEDKRRNREVVDAKMIYAYILQDKGYGCSDISRSIDMHHSSILHYLKGIGFYIKVDRKISSKYEMCKEEYYKEYDPIKYLSSVDLKKELISLRIENKLLSSTSRELRAELEGVNEMQKRLGPLYNIVRERTRIGTENNIVSELNKFYNGVYFYKNK